MVFPGGIALGSDDGKSMRFEIDGKPVSKAEFDSMVRSLKEIPKSRFNAKGEDAMGNQGFVVRYEAEDTNGSMWGIQQLTTSKEVLHAISSKRITLRLASGDKIVGLTDVDGMRRALITFFAQTPHQELLKRWSETISNEAKQGIGPVIIDQGGVARIGMWRVEAQNDHIRLTYGWMADPHANRRFKFCVKMEQGKNGWKAADYGREETLRKGLDDGAHSGTTERNDTP